jgi:hypothetical protein
MGRSISLSKEAREAIKDHIRDHGELTRDKAYEIIEPQFTFYPDESKRREIYRAIQRIITSIRTNEGKRSCFNYKTDKNSIYVNIETTKSVQSLDAVDDQLRRQHEGLEVSRKRVSRHRAVLQGFSDSDISDNG